MTPVSRSAAATMNRAADREHARVGKPCERLFRLEDAKRGQKTTAPTKSDIGGQVSHQADQEHDQDRQGRPHLERQSIAHEHPTPRNQASTRAPSCQAGRSAQSQPGTLDVRARLRRALAASKMVGRSPARPQGLKIQFQTEDK